MQRLLGKHCRIEFVPPADGKSPPLFGVGAVEADVYACDEAAGKVVLRRPHPHTLSKADYFVVAVDLISSVELLRDADASIATVPTLGRAEVDRRVEAAHARAERRLEMQGVGVTEKEQKLFDEMVKQCVFAAEGEGGGGGGPAPG
jgi:hypothetical protein